MSGSNPTAGSSTHANAEPAAPPALAVACSGGPDSMALLWVAWRCASALGINTWAFHVHHGLQPAADAWPTFLATELARWSALHPDRPGVHLAVRRLTGRPGRGQSVEAWAREGRYQALQDMATQAGVDLILLAHHRQDQAETFLLQALRGAGPQGLAGMPALSWRQGICWARPLLNHGRSSLEQVLSQAQLKWVDDPSNQDRQWARNGLRLAVWPALVEAFPAAEVALARAAQRCAQALETVEQGVQADRALCVVEEREAGRCWRLDEGAWQALSGARKSQLLRAWFTECGVSAPSSLVDRLCAESWGPGRAKRWPLDGSHELRWYRGELQIARIPAVAGAPEDMALRWTRAGGKPLPGWGGRLILRRTAPDELGAALRLPCTLLLRSRRGDDQFLLKPGGTLRSLKKQFQSRARPAWERDAPVVNDEAGSLMWVHGLGWDARVPQTLGGWQLHWAPDEAPLGA